MEEKNNCLTTYDKWIFIFLCTIPIVYCYGIISILMDCISIVKGILE